MKTGQESVKPFLIPVRRYRKLAGVFKFADGAILCSARDVDRLPLEQLAGDLKRRPGARARIVFNAFAPCAVRIVRDAAVKQAEGYRLDVRPEGVEIAAATDAGAYYGVQTVRELIAMHGRSLPCCRIDDGPDFKRRGVYFDVARGKVPTVDTLKALVERLSRWKINEFQIYVKNTFTWKAHPAIGRGFSPYTPQDIIDIEAHCRKHHIRFVPSLATLSHAELILQLPAYRHLAELPGYNGWEGGTMLCPTDPRSLRLVEDLYREYLPLFEADDMNICCDEPWELGKGRSRRAAERRGAGRVYFDFLLKVHKLCARHGKRMNVWGDIVLKHAELIGDLPDDIVMQNWDYAAGGGCMTRTREFTAAGLAVLACPGTSGWQRHGTDLPNAIDNMANFSAVARRQKIEGILNTDWGDFGHRNPLGVSLHGYAHGAAHSWNGRGVDDATFTDAFAFHVFDGDRRLAGALRVLGGSARTVGDTTMLYHALIEPLVLPCDRFLRTFRRVPVTAHYPSAIRDTIGPADPKKLQRVVSDLGASRLWPAVPAKLPAFERQALAECRLAGRMDLAAARRALLAQRIRGGEPVGKRDLLGWADSMRRLNRDFESLWLARNRPSRLADNLKLMRLAEAEARQLAAR